MNEQQIAGIGQQIAGKLKETWGELTGDPLRAAAGRHGQIAGKAEQLSGIEKEQSARQLQDFLHHNRNWHF